MKVYGTIGTALLAVLTLGCGLADEAAQETDGDSALQQSMAANLDPQALQRLIAEYPVLREEPVPQPRPEPGAERGEQPRRALETSEGEATFYADSFEGRRTASGIPFRQNQFVAAHRGFPFGTLLRVTNLSNDRTVNVRVVDRGPHGSRAQARNTIIDLSRRAAEALDYTSQGRTPVRVEVIEWGDGLPQSS